MPLNILLLYMFADDDEDISRVDINCSDNESDNEFDGNESEDGEF